MRLGLKVKSNVAPSPGLPCVRTEGGERGMGKPEAGTGSARVEWVRGCSFLKTSLPWLLGLPGHI